MRVVVGLGEVDDVGVIRSVEVVDLQGVVGIEVGAEDGPAGGCGDARSAVGVGAPVIDPRAGDGTELPESAGDGVGDAAARLGVDKDDEAVGVPALSSRLPGMASSRFPLGV
jgi:hypothetical protein